MFLKYENANEIEMIKIDNLESIKAELLYEENRKYIAVVGYGNTQKMILKAYQIGVICYQNEKEKEDEVRKKKAAMKKAHDFMDMVVAAFENKEPVLYVGSKYMSTIKMQGGNNA